MTFTVTRTPKGLYLGMCHRCGHTGRYKTEWDAHQAEHTHLCTHPEEGEAA